MENYANFISRAVAVFIDSFILFFIGGILSVVAGLILSLLTVFILDPITLTGGIYAVVSWLYHALSEASSWRATLGKMAMGIYVSDMEGNRISFPRATVRYLSKILSAMFLGLGYLLALFTRKNQALHDLIAGTLVLNK